MNLATALGLLAGLSLPWELLALTVPYAWGRASRDVHGEAAGSSRQSFLTLKPSRTCFGDGRAES